MRLIANSEIKKVEGSKGQYQLISNNISKADLTKILYSESEIMNTEIMKRWQQNNHAKNEHDRYTRMANICLGVVNPKFKS